MCHGLAQECVLTVAMELCWSQESGIWSTRDETGLYWPLYRVQTIPSSSTLTTALRNILLSETFLWLKLHTEIVVGASANAPCGLGGRCRISPPRFLAECCKRQLNQVSLVLLYFRLSAFSDLYWVCLSVFSCTVLFVSISQVIGCEDRLRNDLYCVGWGVKLYSNLKPKPVKMLRTGSVALW